jgi:hypothetical protein
MAQKLVSIFWAMLNLSWAMPSWNPGLEYHFILIKKAGLFGMFALFYTLLRQVDFLAPVSRSILYIHHTYILQLWLHTMCMYIVQ